MDLHSRRNRDVCRESASQRFDRHFCDTADLLGRRIAAHLSTDSASVVMRIGFSARVLYRLRRWHRLHADSVVDLCLAPEPGVEVRPVCVERVPAREGNFHGPGIRASFKAAKVTGWVLHVKLSCGYVDAVVVR